MSNMYDAIVVGAGPAGTAAALYVARQKRRVLTIDQGFDSGPLGSAEQVLDYPGVGDKPSGEALIKRMRWQAKDAGAEFRDAEICSAAFGSSGRMVFAKDEKKFEARTIILATGIGPAPHPVPGEREFLGRGVSYSTIRDGYAYAKTPVALYGKGVEAAEAAIALLRQVESIDWIIPSNKLDVPDRYQDRLKESKQLRLLFSSSIKEIRGNHHLEEVVVLKGGQEKVLTVNAIFFCHRAPHTEAAYLAGTVETGEHGNVLVNPSLETSIPGVFACGDILCGIPQIPSIAVAQGIMAAMGVEKVLSGNGSSPR